MLLKIRGKSGGIDGDVLFFRRCSRGPPRISVDVKLNFDFQVARIADFPSFGQIHSIGRVGGVKDRVFRRLAVTIGGYYAWCMLAVHICPSDDLIEVKTEPDTLFYR